MMPLKEFRCAAHGPFEALVKLDETKTPCPRGCSTRFVKQEIRTAPSFHGGKTAVQDAMQKDLATSYGLPDLKVDKDDGRSVMDRLRRDTTDDYSTRWADVPGKMAPGWSKRGETPVSINPRATFGMQGGNELAPSKLSTAIPTQIMGRAKAEDIS
jgi:hypothetical protein